jgi:hypothetical protein
MLLNETDTTQKEERSITVGKTSAYIAPHTNTQHNRKYDPSLWDTLAHRRDHMLKDYEIAEAQQFASNSNFKHLAMAISVETRSEM